MVSGAKVAVVAEAIDSAFAREGEDSARAV